MKTKTVIKRLRSLYDRMTENDFSSRAEDRALAAAIAALEAPVLADALEARFPWLGTEEGDVSGADVIQELELWYRAEAAR